MVQPLHAEFTAPFEADRLLEIRTSRMKRMPGLNIESGIDKQICNQPMKVSKLGLDGDEHDPTFHGGPDKAILGCELIIYLVHLLFLILFQIAHLTILIGGLPTQNVPTYSNLVASERTLSQLT